MGETRNGDGLFSRTALPFSEFKADETGRGAEGAEIRHSQRSGASGSGSRQDLAVIYLVGGYSANSATPRLTRQGSILFEHPDFPCLVDGFTAIADAQLLEDVPRVGLHRL